MVCVVLAGGRVSVRAYVLLGFPSLTTSLQGSRGRAFVGWC